MYDDYDDDDYDDSRVKVAYWEYLHTINAQHCTASAYWADVFKEAVRQLAKL